ncbi:MAG: metalloregulator ArsR/SmtB family transcription factor [Vicingaceae bacterium]|nr:metalloregulator ArsR/SmtB family transcription factor [Vicingaceae bacterium]
MQQKIDKIFKAIADPTRREILHALVVASVALPITDISAKFDISRQGVTKHIKILADANLVEIKKNGREQMIYPNPKSLKTVSDWLKFYENFWDDKLKNLANYLDNK